MFHLELFVLGVEIVFWALLWVEFLVLVVFVSRCSSVACHLFNVCILWVGRHDLDGVGDVHDN